MRAAHARRDSMEQLKAHNERQLQHENWLMLMEWEGQSVAAGESAQQRSKRLFQEQLAMRETHAADAKAGVLSYRAAAPPAVAEATGAPAEESFKL